MGIPVRLEGRKMKQRLKYERVNNSNDVIKIDLHNGYQVIAVSGKGADDEYTTTLFIKDVEIDTWREIESKITFVATYKTINSAILKHVSQLLDNGTMDKYIDSYHFEIMAIDLGIDLMEMEGVCTE